MDVMSTLLEKTTAFYRNFLDGLYAVADLINDRPEFKPNDKTYRNTVEDSLILMCYICIELVSYFLWTKKWAFEHFVKRKRKKDFLFFNP